MHLVAHMQSFTKVTRHGLSNILLTNDNLFKGKLRREFEAIQQLSFSYYDVNYVAI